MKFTENQKRVIKYLKQNKIEYTKLIIDGDNVIYIKPSVLEKINKKEILNLLK